jgi:hypothetical protein
MILAHHLGVLEPEHNKTRQTKAQYSFDINLLRKTAIPIL